MKEKTLLFWSNIEEKHEHFLLIIYLVERLYNHSRHTSRNTTMGIPNEIVDLILEEKEEISQIFIDHLQGIFSSTKYDIMRFCEQVEMDRLLELRHNLFQKLCEERISMSNRELTRRKKRNRVIEDIYIIGNSLVNGLEDKNMRKVLKKENINDDTLSTSDSESNESMVQICAELKLYCNSLKDEVKKLEDRILILETEMSDMKKSTTCHLKQSYTKYSKENETSTGESFGKKNKILVKVDVHKDIDGNTQKISVPSTKDDDPDIITIEPDSDTGNPDAFRHTQKDRKKILKGTMGSKFSTATNNAKPSESNNKHVYNFNIEAAYKKSSDSSGPTYLVYIGKLAARTTQQSLRKHLLQIGIQNKELSDILQLRCRNENERSFCVSIDGEDGKDKIYNLQNWPAGVRIRPFKRRVYGQNKSGYSQTHSTSLHSSFPNIHSASKHSR